MLLTDSWHRRLRPGAALLHPAWWLALLTMAANDHLFKADPALAGMVTGKLSDVTGLFVAPALLATLLCVRTPRGLLAVHAAVGLWFAAMNLSHPFAQAWAGLTALGPLPAWHPVVDAPDLLTLPMLAVAWWVLLPAMQAVPAPVRPVRRLRQGLALAVGSLLLMGNEAPNEFEPQRFVFAMPNVSVALGNSTSKEVLLRVRPLRKTVQVDCEAVFATPHAQLSRKLFGPAEVWRLQAGEVVDFAGATDNDRTCSAYLVDGPLIPMRLLFWRSAGFPNTFVQSGLGQDNSRVVVLGAKSGAAVWSPHAALFAPPPALDPAPVAACPFPDVEDALAWSAPVPFGKGVTLATLVESPDGCLALDVEKGAAKERWYLCVPYASFPFVSGALLTIATVKTDFAFGAMDGLSLTAGATILTAGRGTSVPYFGKGNVQLVPSPGCEGRFDSCGGLALRLELKVTGIPFEKDQTVQVGQAALLGLGKTLHLMRAMRRVTVDSACKDEVQNADNSGSPVLGPMVESVLVEAP